MTLFAQFQIVTNFVCSLVIIVLLVKAWLLWKDGRPIAKDRFRAEDFRRG